VALLVAGALLLELLELERAGVVRSDRHVAPVLPREAPS
jgi:hypothetical protein